MLFLGTIFHARRYGKSFSNHVNTAGILLLRVLLKKRKGKTEEEALGEAKREIPKSLDAFSQSVVIIKVFREGGKCGKPPQDRDRNLVPSECSLQMHRDMCAYILSGFRGASGADHINQPKTHTLICRSAAL